MPLDKYSAAIFEAFRQRSDGLYDAVMALQKGIRSGTATALEAAQTPVTTTDIAAETPEIDSEAEETE